MKERKMFRASILFVTLAVVVGREGVLSSTTSRDPRCGRRLVSGLFTKPRLPLGYSHVATVPAGACRFNVSELVPSENYIALKLTNGSFIMNGAFAVSAPGVYEAAGAQFVYRRAAGTETVYTHGPTMQPVDIMILYQHPNPSIKYEYLTDTTDLIGENAGPQSASKVAGEAGAVSDGSAGGAGGAGAARHQHRHHNSDAHTRALPTSEPAEPDNALNGISGGPARARGFAWKVLAYSSCSRSCGGGIQTGAFRCVDGGGREAAGARCTGPAPPTRRRRCNVGACPPRWRTAAWSACPDCGPATRRRAVGCVQDHARGLTKISDQKCPLPVPLTTEPCDIPACVDIDSNAIPTDEIRTKSEPRAPDGRKTLDERRTYDGRKVSDERRVLEDHRGVDARRQVKERDETDTFRDALPRTMVTRLNNGTVEEGAGAELGPEYSVAAADGWLFTEWSECVGWCEAGVRTRGVWCAGIRGCAGAAPLASESCAPAACHVHQPHRAHWYTGAWSACSSSCGGRQVRGVVCLGGAGRRAPPSACRLPRPPAERACGAAACPPAWYLTDWGQCTGACGAGVQTRTVWCGGGGAGAGGDSDCAAPRPPSRRSCAPPHCASAGGAAAPALPSPAPALDSDTQRIARNQNTNTQDKTTNFQSTRNEGCTDQLSSCALAVQARLCHYHYYTLYCCRSCAPKM